MRSALARACLAGVLGGGVVAAACHDDALVQYDDYRPPNELPLGEPTARDDAGAPRDAAAEDGGAPLKLDDASAPPDNTCGTARAIGSLSGDRASILSAAGACSEWLSFRATEDDNGGAPMNLKLTLTPAGGPFSLFVSFDPIRDVVTCTSVAANDGSLTWGEGSVPNGGDDSRTIRVAIIKRGACGTERWALDIEGQRP